MTKERLDEFTKLQEVLARKYEIEERISDLPKSLSVNTESLERFKKSYIEKNEEYEAEKAKVNALKEELETTEKEREANEKNMDSVQTNRDIEELSKKINEAQLKEQDLRKDLQKEEKILAEMNENINTDQLLISTQEAQLKEAQENLDKNLSLNNKELENLKKEEEKLSLLIDPEKGLNSETIIKFQRIIKRNAKGIVAVRGIVCDGCHMYLPANFANEVRRGKDILFCPYCSRILFYEEADENDAIEFPMDEVGGLDISDDEFNDEDEVEITDEGFDESDVDDHSSFNDSEDFN